MRARKWIGLVVLFLGIPALIYGCFRAGGRMYYLSSTLMIVLTALPFFLRFERRRPQTRELVVLAVLCALAVVSRAMFAPVAHFKPMAAIIMISGAAFGAEAGFLVGAVSAFASNFLFGQGPWTPWQMFAFGVGGFLAGLLCRRGILPRKPLPLAVFGFGAVMLVVGPLLDTSTLLTQAAAIGWQSAAAVYLSGIPVNVIHGLATFLTLLLLSRPMLEKLDRICTKYGMMEE